MSAGYQSNIYTCWLCIHVRLTNCSQSDMPSVQHARLVTFGHVGLIPVVYVIIYACIINCHAAAVAWCRG